MKLKRVLSFGVLTALALFVVVAAGCGILNSEGGSNKDYYDPIEGQWGVHYQDEGQDVEAYITVNHDKNAYWITLGDKPWYQVTTLVWDTWENYKDNTYGMVVNTNGHVYTFTYDQANDTLISEDGMKLKRTDGFVGIWCEYSLDVDKTDIINTYHVKSDGTGVTYSSKWDGWSYAVSFTWTRSDNGKYTIVNKDGYRHDLTLADDALTGTTDVGSTWTKCFMDDTFIVPVASVWYNADKNITVRLNGDRTGSMVLPEGKADFVWDMNDAGQYEVKYVSGNVSYMGEDTPLAGVKLAWTYVPETDTFISGTGTVLQRATQTVDGLIYANL